VAELQFVALTAAGIADESVCRATYGSVVGGWYIRLPPAVHGVAEPDCVQPPAPTKMRLVCVLLAPAPLNVMESPPVLFEAKEQFVPVTDPLPLNASPPPKAKAHAGPVTNSAAVASSRTSCEPDPTIKALKLRGSARAIRAWTALHDGVQDPLVSALKLPPLQLPGWMVTVVFDPDVYPLSVATLTPAVWALEKPVAPEMVVVV
jgi:hypothetical protein